MDRTAHHRFSTITMSLSFCPQADLHHGRTKHIDIRNYFLRDKVFDNTVKLCQVGTQRFLMRVRQVRCIG